MLRLKLCGFLRHATERAFEFPLKGLTLLEAQNGSGKTSICEAVAWVLYGEGRDVIHNGSDRCYVQLEAPEIVIYRQKMPDQLRVSVRDVQGQPVEYTDAVAQATIVQLYGPPRLWRARSYLCEEPRTTLLNLPPKERAAIVQELALGEEKAADRVLDELQLLLSENKREQDSLRSVTQARLQRWQVEWGRIQPPPAADEIQSLDGAAPVGMDYTTTIQRATLELASITRLEATLETTRRRAVAVEAELATLDPYAAVDVITLQTELQTYAARRRAVEARSRLMAAETQLARYPGEPPSSGEIERLRAQHARSEYARSRFEALQLPYDPLVVTQRIVDVHDRIQRRRRTEAHDLRLRQRQQQMDLRTAQERQLRSEIDGWRRALPPPGGSEDELRTRVHQLESGLDILLCPHCHQPCRHLQGRLEVATGTVSTRADLDAARRQLLELQQTEHRRRSVLASLELAERRLVELQQQPTPEEVPALAEREETPLDRLTAQLAALQALEYAPPIQTDVAVLAEHRRLFDLVLDLRALSTSGEECGLEELDRRQSEIPRLIQGWQRRESLLRDLTREREQERTLIQERTTLATADDLRERIRIAQAELDRQRRRQQIEPLYREWLEIQALEGRQSQLIDYAVRLTRFRERATEVQLRLLRSAIASLNGDLQRLCPRMDLPHEQLLIQFNLQRRLKQTGRHKAEISPVTSVNHEERRRLSKGQRDRLHVVVTLALARAPSSFRPFPVLVLDDTQCSMDAAAEALTLRTLRKAAKRRGVLCVAHRTDNTYYDEVRSV